MAYIQKIGDSPIGDMGLITCPTASGTAAKVSSTSTNDTAFDSLTHGMTVYVKFTYSNTASSPTFNLNSTGAKPIFRYGTTYPGTTVATSWNAGEVVSLTYDSTYSTTGCWRMNDWNFDVNTHYTASMVAGSSGSSSNTTTVSPYLVLRENGSARSNIQLAGNNTPSATTNCSGGYITKSSSGAVTSYIPTYSGSQPTNTGAVEVAIEAGSIQIPEIIIIANINTSSTPINITIRLPYIAFSKMAINQYISDGYFQNSNSPNSNGGSLTLKKTGDSTIKLESAYVNGTDKTSTTTWTVYYAWSNA